ncbi:unnamed protein product, partial [Symbiodinium sp. KB8]
FIRNPEFRELTQTVALLAAQSLRGALPDVYLPGPWPEEASWEELAASAAPAEAVEPYFGAITVAESVVKAVALNLMRTREEKEIHTEVLAELKALMGASTTLSQ